MCPGTQCTLGGGGGGHVGQLEQIIIVTTWNLLESYTECNATSMHLCVLHMLVCVCVCMCVCVCVCVCEVCVCV